MWSRVAFQFSRKQETSYTCQGIQDTPETWGGGLRVQEMWIGSIWSLPEHLPNRSSYVPVQLKTERRAKHERCWVRSSPSAEVRLAQSVWASRSSEAPGRMFLPNGFCYCKPLIFIRTKLQQTGAFSQKIFLRGLREREIKEVQHENGNFIRKCSFW